MKSWARALIALAGLLLFYPFALRAATANNAEYRVVAVYGFPAGNARARVKLTDGGTLEYSESLSFAYSGPVDPKSVRVTVAPEAPFALHAFGYGATMQVRKVPGVTYTVTIEAASATGAQAAPYTFRFSTPRVANIPEPIARAAGPYRYGTLGHAYPNSLGGPGRDRLIALDAEAGVRFVRIDYAGKDIEPSRGSYAWATTDAIRDHLLAAGITEMPCLVQYEVSPWATNGKPHPAVWADPREFAEFAGAVAEHLKPQLRITRIEIFNEANLHHWGEFPTDASAANFDDSGRRAALYMQMAYAAIKAHNPRLTVVGPALSSGGTQTPPVEFLENMYAAGCRTGTCWDVLSVHSYDPADPDIDRPPDRNDGRVDNYKDLQAVAVAHGDPKPHVMLDEHGFSSAMRPDGFDPAVQALYMAKLFNRALSDPTVDGIVWVNIDIGYRPGPTDFFGRTSLVDPDGHKLPAFETYRRFAKS